jgi:C4-dicarboxylate-specific signal transduction histidine kinase
LFLPPEDFIGKKPSEVLPPHIVEIFDRAFERNKKNEVSVFEYCLEIKGESRWFSAKMAPIFMEDVFMGTVLVTRDVTEHRKSEAALHEYHEKMARAEQLASVGILGATFAHQMNQPLTAIRLFLQQSLRELKKNQKAQQVIVNLEDSLAEITKAISVTSQFLQYSRRSSQDRICNMHLQEIAEKIVTLLSESAHRAKIRLVLESMGDLPGIEGNPAEIEQVFFILTQNAIQAGEGRDGSELHIRGSFRNGMVEVEFQDTCGGVAAENQEKVFQPFFTTKPPGIGTGLGLCILQQIVSKHGGKVKMDNHIGSGVTFCVSLPVCN